MVNHRKVIFSLLKEIKENKSEPKVGDYGLETAEFGDIVDMMLDEKLITGASVSRGGRGNVALVVFLNGSKITIKGLEYLEENSAWAKTYKGLKEVRDWLPL